MLGHLIEKRDVSADWLRHQERRERRAGVDGVTIRLPGRKLTNEIAWWQTRKLRRVS